MRSFLRAYHGGARNKAFTLVEIALAIGVVAFALLSVVALLPLGARTNKTAYEETVAAGLLGMIESDLRNSHPADGPTSRLYGLPLPYGWNNGLRTVAVTGSTGAIPGTSASVGVSDAGAVQPTSSNPLARYQLTVVFTQVPAAGSSSPILARVIVNWPCLPTTPSSNLSAQQILDLTSARVGGWAESTVAFPAP